MEIGGVDLGELPRWILLVFGVVVVIVLMQMGLFPSSMPVFGRNVQTFDILGVVFILGLLVYLKHVV